jgi:hypothetical protein
MSRRSDAGPHAESVPTAAGQEFGDLRGGLVHREERREMAAEFDEPLERCSNASTYSTPSTCKPTDRTTGQVTGKPVVIPVVGA